jgi:O-antigen/teichoic acid export membrane protein
VSNAVSLPISTDASRSFVKSGFSVFALRIGALFLAFAADAVLTRSLGTERYGVLAIGISLMSILITISTLGLNTALNKIIPTARVEGRGDLVQGVIGWSAKWMLIASVALGALFAGCVWLAGDQIGTSLRAVLFIFALFLPVQVLATHRRAVLQALKHPVKSLLPEQAIRSLAVLVLIGGVFLIQGERLTLLQAAWMYCAGMGVAFIVAHLWKNQHVGRDLAPAKPSVTPALWWALALPMCWNSVMRMLNSSADPAMLGWLDSAESAAHFAIANRLTAFLMFGTMAVNAVAAPMIAELHAKGKTAELQRILNLAAKGLALYAIPMSAALFIGGPWILTLFGEGFDQAYTTLCILAVGRVLTCLVGIVGFLLSMTGHHARVARVMTISAIAKVILNIILIPQFGAEGAALATLVMLVMFSGLLWRDVRRELGVDPSLLALLRPIPQDRS